MQICGNDTKHIWSDQDNLQFASCLLPFPSWTPPSSAVRVGSSTTFVAVTITATRTTIDANTCGGSGWPRGMRPRECCWWATMWWSPGCCGCSLIMTTQGGSGRDGPGTLRCNVCCKYIEREKVHVCET